MSDQPIAYDAAPTSVDRTARIRVGSLGANTLLLTGLALSAGGGALLAAPAYSWKATKVADWLVSHGGGLDMLIVGGLALTGMGIVGRGVARVGRGLNHALSQINAEDTTLALSLSVDQVAAETAAMRARVDAVGASVKDLAAAQARAAASETPDNGVFRLAASLDQLGVRLERRMEGGLKAVQSEIELVSGALAALDERLGSIEREVGAVAQRVSSLEAARAETHHVSNHSASQPANHSASPTGRPAAPAQEAPVEEDLYAEGAPVLELFDRMERGSDDEEEVQSIYEPEPALPERPAPPPAATYERALDSLLPDASVLRAVDPARRESAKRQPDHD